MRKFIQSTAIFAIAVMFFSACSNKSEQAVKVPSSSKDAFKSGKDTFTAKITGLIFDRNDHYALVQFDADGDGEVDGGATTELSNVGILIDPYDSENRWDSIKVIKVPANFNFGHLYKVSTVCGYSEKKIFAPEIITGMVEYITIHADSTYDAEINITGSNENIGCSKSMAIQFLTKKAKIVTAKKMTDVPYGDYYEVVKFE